LAVICASFERNLIAGGHNDREAEVSVMIMRASSAFVLLAAGLAVPARGFGAPAGAADVPPPVPLDSTADSAAGVRAVTAAWPEKSRLLASAIVSEYGAPDEIAPSQLIWRHCHPWTQIAVYRDPAAAKRPDNLLEALAYEVPVRRWRALGAFQRGASYDPVRRELVARGENEGANLLALNLADEVVRGRRTPAEANAFYDDTLSLSYSGKSSAYMLHLMFSPILRPSIPRSHWLDDELDLDFPLSDGN
jgi:hypothetical protein